MRQLLTTKCGVAAVVIAVLAWLHTGLAAPTTSASCATPSCGVAVVTSPQSNNLPLQALASHTVRSDSQPSLQSFYITNPCWDIPTVMACWNDLTSTNDVRPLEDIIVQRLISNALTNNIPPPHSGRELLEILYSVNWTNTGDGCLYFILKHVTNEAYTDMLFWAITNFHFLSLSSSPQHAALRHRHSGKAMSAIYSLRAIGTPPVIDRLNKLLRQLCNEGRPIHAPAEVISAVKYPVEAREWLLRYPEQEVRHRMIAKWLISGRPETPELLTQWCKTVKSMPDDFYLWKGDENIRASKIMIIREVKRERDAYIRRYKRWIEDGQREHFNSGTYEDPD